MLAQFRMSLVLDTYTLVVEQINLYSEGIYRASVPRVQGIHQHCMNGPKLSGTLKMFLYLLKLIHQEADSEAKSVENRRNRLDWASIP